MMELYREDFDITKRKYKRELSLEFRDKKIYNLYFKYFDTSLNQSLNFNTLDFSEINDIFTNRLQSFFQTINSIYILDEKKEHEIISFLYQLYFIKFNKSKLKDNIKIIELALQNQDKEIVDSAKKYLIDESLVIFAESETQKFMLDILNNDIVDNNSLKKLYNEIKKNLKYYILNKVSNILGTEILNFNSIEDLKKEIERVDKSNLFNALLKILNISVSDSNLLKKIQNIIIKYQKEKNNKLIFTTHAAFIFFFNLYVQIREIIDNNTIDAITFDYIYRNYTDEYNGNKLMFNMEIKVKSIFKKKNYFKDERNSIFIYDYLKIDKNNMYEIIKGDNFKDFVNNILSNTEALFKENFMFSDLLAFDLSRPSIDKQQNKVLLPDEIVKIKEFERIKNEWIIKSQVAKDIEQENSLIERYSNKSEYDLQLYLENVYPYYFFQGLLNGLRTYLLVKTLLSKNKLADIKQKIAIKIKKVKNNKAILSLKYLYFLLLNKKYIELIIIILISQSMQLSKVESLKLLKILNLSSVVDFNEKYDELTTEILVNHFGYNSLYINYLLTNNYS